MWMQLDLFPTNSTRLDVKRTAGPSGDARAYCLMTSWLTTGKKQVYNILFRSIQNDPPANGFKHKSRIIFQNNDYYYVMPGVGLFYFIFFIMMI